MAKVLVRNKQAHFNYAIEETVQAGIALKGYEVKSVKGGNASLKGSYVSVRGEEAFLVNAHIGLYEKAGPMPDYNPRRDRKLLLKKAEIKRLIGTYKAQGMALIPLEMRQERGLVKLLIGVGRGKKKYDKREAIAKREAERRIRRAIRRER